MKEIITVVDVGRKRKGNDPIWNDSDMKNWKDMGRN